MKVKRIVMMLFLLISFCLNANEISNKTRKDKDGNAINEEGHIYLPADQIFVDEKGNEKALDWYYKKTGLTPLEFYEHQLGYEERKEEILKSLNGRLDISSCTSWYDFRVNLEKIEEINDLGVTLIRKWNEGKGGKFENDAIYADAVFIGEIIEYKKMNVVRTSCIAGLKIRVGEIIKKAKDIELGKEIECARYYEAHYDDYSKRYGGFPINKKCVIAIGRSIGRPLEYYPFVITNCSEIENETLKGYYSYQGEYYPQEMPLAEYKRVIKKITKINDSDNFYKKNWRVNNDK